MEEASLVINHPLFPTESGMKLSEELLPREGHGGLSGEQQITLCSLVGHRRVEADLNVLAEYLENCSSDVLPFKYVETIQNWNNYDTFLFIHARIHPTYQLRLANSIYTIFTTKNESMELLNVIVNCSIWDFYATSNKGRTSERNFQAWLDDPSAQRKMSDAFTEYRTKLASGAESPHRNVLLRLQQILQGIDLWHPAVEFADVLPNMSIIDPMEYQLAMVDRSLPNSEMKE
ncbi:hypothetical protein C8R45DRAFT_1178301 [Mycena sanguinolenta]|nr:hypothetical protein C8R45DRAFT_1178301 [Mycena sanguinolenta]